MSDEATPALAAAVAVDAAPAKKISPAKRVSQLIDDWFAQRGWKVFPFQRAVWKAALAGQSGLLHATTGLGKT